MDLLERFVLWALRMNSRLRHLRWEFADARSRVVRAEASNEEHTASLLLEKSRKASRMVDAYRLAKQGYVLEPTEKATEGVDDG